MLNHLVALGKFTKIHTNHVSLAFDWDESFTSMAVNSSTNHFREDDHTSKVSLYNSLLALVILVIFTDLTNLFKEELITVCPALVAEFTLVIDLILKLFAVSDFLWLQTLHASYLTSDAAASDFSHFIHRQFHNFFGFISLEGGFRKLSFVSCHAMWSV